jgi:hypothetical protein
MSRMPIVRHLTALAPHLHNASRRSASLSPCTRRHRLPAPLLQFLAKATARPHHASTAAAMSQPGHVALPAADPPSSKQCRPLSPQRCSAPRHVAPSAELHLTIHHACEPEPPHHRPVADVPLPGFLPVAATPRPCLGSTSIKPQATPCSDIKSPPASPLTPRCRVTSTSCLCPRRWPTFPQP